MKAIALILLAASVLASSRYDEPAPAQVVQQQSQNFQQSDDSQAAAMQYNAAAVQNYAAQNDVQQTVDVQSFAPQTELPIDYAAQNYAAPSDAQQVPTLQVQSMDGPAQGQQINQFLPQQQDNSQQAAGSFYNQPGQQAQAAPQDDASQQQGDISINQGLDVAQALDSSQIQQDKDSNYTILTEPLVIPVEAEIEGSDGKVKPKINVLLYGKIPKNMPLINLKLSVSKDFLKNFDEFGNPKPGFKIDLDKLTAKNLPDVLPRPEQPQFVQVGAERKLMETRVAPRDFKIKPAISVLAHNDQGQKGQFQQRPYQPAAQQQAKPSLWQSVKETFSFNKPAAPVQAAQPQMTQYSFVTPRRGHQCSPVPKIGHPVLLMAKLFKSIRGQFSNDKVENKLVFQQAVNGIYYLVFKSVAVGHAPQFFGISFDSVNSQVINFSTSPNLTLITSQLGIAQINPTDEVECGNLTQVFRGEMGAPVQNQAGSGYGTIINVGESH